MAELPEPSLLVQAIFIGLPVLMALLWSVALHVQVRMGPPTALALALWMGLTGGLAQAGLLFHFDPPRVVGLFVVTLLIVVWSWSASWGDALSRLPLGVLVGFQCFRIVVEIGIHQAAVEGIAPRVMTWEGQNLEIVSGVSALVLAPFASRLPRWVLRAWNAVCAGILVVVLVTAVLATPGPMRLIVTEPGNTWVSTFPFVWLPTVLVLAALVGHVVLARRLRRDGMR
jgi:hypothetical protein